MWLTITGVILLLVGLGWAIADWWAGTSVPVEVNWANKSFKGSFGAFLTLAGIGSLIFYYSAQAGLETIRTQEKTIELKQAEIDSLTSLKGDLTTERDQLSGELKTAQGALQAATTENQTLSNELVQERENARLANETLQRTLIILDTSTMTERERAEVDAIEKGVLDLNTSLKTIELVRVSGPVVGRRTKRADFVMAEAPADTHAMALFQFQSRSIDLTDQNGDPVREETKQVLAQNFCIAADRAMTSEVGFLDALKQVDPRLADIVVDQKAKALLESAYVRVALKRRVSQAAILLRGYADGQESDWSEPLPDSREHVDVHPLVREEGALMEFNGETRTISQGNGAAGALQYANADLPNLRAATVKKEFDALTFNCQWPGETGVQSGGDISLEILEGRASAERLPQSRRVVAYLQIYLNEP